VFPPLPPPVPPHLFSPPEAPPGYHPPTPSLFTPLLLAPPLPPHSPLPPQPVSPPPAPPPPLPLPSLLLLPRPPSPSEPYRRPEYIPNRIDDPNYVRIFEHYSQVGLCPPLFPPHSAALPCASLLSALALSPLPSVTPWCTTGSLVHHHRASGAAAGPLAQASCAVLLACHGCALGVPFAYHGRNQAIPFGVPWVVPQAYRLCTVGVPPSVPLVYPWAYHKRTLCVPWACMFMQGWGAVPGATLTSKEKLDIARQLARLGWTSSKPGSPLLRRMTWRPCAALHWTWGTRWVGPREEYCSGAVA